MTYRIAPFRMTLSDIHSNSPIASLFKCDFSYTWATGDEISSDSASRGPSAIAEVHRRHNFLNN